MQLPSYEQQQQTDSKYRKTEFLRTSAGVHTVRLIPPVHSEFTHYVHNITVACLGDNCPVCQNNKKIIAENPANFRNIPGYSSKRYTHYVNVLDRTPARICPNCNQEVKADLNGRISAVCPKCQTVIADVPLQPLNKVKVLSRGKELFEQLAVIQTTKRNDAGEQIGLENFDIDLTVGSNRQPVPSARLDRMDAITVPDEELFELENAIIRLSAEEINELLRGISLKDIFSNRRVENVSEDSVARVSEDFHNDIKSKVDSMFK